MASPGLSFPVGKRTISQRAAAKRGPSGRRDHSGAFPRGRPPGIPGV